MLRAASTPASRPVRGRRARRSRSTTVGLPYSHMVSDTGPARRRTAATPRPSGARFTADDDGVGAAHDLDGHGQRLAADPDDPPADRHRRAAARSTTSPRSPRRARRESADRAVVDGAVALALTGHRRGDRRRRCATRLGIATRAGSAAGSVDAEDAAQDVGDLAERGATRERDAHRHEEVLGPARGRLEVGERGRDRRRPRGRALSRATRSACAACWAHVDGEDVAAARRRRPRTGSRRRRRAAPSSTASASA